MRQTQDLTTLRLVYSTSDGVALTCSWYVRTAAQEQHRDEPFAWGYLFGRGAPQRPGGQSGRAGAGRRPAHPPCWWQQCRSPSSPCQTQTHPALSAAGSASAPSHHSQQTAALCLCLRCTHVVGFAVCVTSIVCSESLPPFTIANNLEIVTLACSAFCVKSILCIGGQPAVTTGNSPQG